jgi:hypothetical protein
LHVRASEKPPRLLEVWLYGGLAKRQPTVPVLRGRNILMTLLLGRRAFINSLAKTSFVSGGNDVLNASPKTFFDDEVATLHRFLKDQLINQGFEPKKFIE